MGTARPWTMAGVGKQSLGTSASLAPTPTDPDLDTHVYDGSLSLPLGPGRPPITLLPDFHRHRAPFVGCHTVLGTAIVALCELRGEGPPPATGASAAAGGDTDGEGDASVSTPLFVDDVTKREEEWGITVRERADPSSHLVRVCVCVCACFRVACCVSSGSACAVLTPALVCPLCVCACPRAFRTIPSAGWGWRAAV